MSKGCGDLEAKAGKAAEVCIFSGKFVKDIYQILLFKIYFGKKCMISRLPQWDFKGPPDAGQIYIFLEHGLSMEGVTFAPGWSISRKNV